MTCAGCGGGKTQAGRVCPERDLLVYPTPQTAERRAVRLRQQGWIVDTFRCRDHWHLLLEPKRGSG